LRKYASAGGVPAELRRGALRRVMESSLCNDGNLAF